MRKIEHIGIAVSDMKKSVELFKKLLGAEPYKSEKVETESVITTFFRSGPNKIELVQGTGENSVISKYIDKYGEGIHHIAFDVENIEYEMKRLRKEGFILTSDTPKEGADHKLVCFIHPKSANGLLIELCQEKDT